MNAFNAGKKIEAQSMAILQRFLDDRDNRWVMTNKGPLARYLQEVLGDFIINTAKQECWTVECKAELENRYNNFFLETWSNRNLENRASHGERGSNPGWLKKCRADLLFYHFVGPDDLYIINLFRLQQWALGHGDVKGRMYDFPEKPQSKYVQLNDTWGRCVPISVVKEEVGFRHVNPKQIPLFGDEGEAA
jgi:hypothetical protein